MTKDTFKRWLRRHAMNLESEVGEMNETIDNLDFEQQKEMHELITQIGKARVKICEAIEILRKAGER